MGRARAEGQIRRQAGPRQEVQIKRKMGPRRMAGQTARRPPASTQNAAWAQMVLIADCGLRIADCGLRQSLNQNNQDWYNQPPQDAKVRKDKTCPDRSLRSSAPSAVKLSVPMLRGLI